MKQERVSDELLCEGRVCRFHRIGLRVDTGEVVQRDLVEFPGAVVVVPVRGDGAVVFIRNQRFAVDEELLELPAGMLERDEDPAAAAARELTEETGYTAGRVERLGGFYSCPGATNEYLHVFLATELRDGRQSLEPHERIRLQVVPPGKVGGMIASGELHDAKSIAAWTLWRLRERA